MPKRGERLPFRVEFTYPPSERAPRGVKGTEVTHDIAGAATLARDLRERGASGRIIDRRDGSVVATFTPAHPEPEATDAAAHA